MKFIDRHEDLATLERLYGERASELVVLYGRRRIGKSTLLAHFCENKPNFYFTGRKGEDRRELFDRFLKELSDFLKNPLISKIKTDDWKEIFEIIDAEMKWERPIIVFDEFQWMCTRRSTLISAIQEHWDRKWKGEGRIFLVLCGSIISFMEKDVLSEKSPLYGRRTFSFELGQLPASDAKLFFTERSPFEQGETIMTFGGVPCYLELLDQKESLAQNINRLALTRDGYFVNEINFILSEQLKSPKRYYLLLKKLSQRPMSRAEIAKAMGIDNSGALNLYLKTLTDLHLIKLASLVTKGESAKTQRYMVWDEFLRFYFSFIAPNKDLISMNNEGEWLYDRIVAPKREVFCGYSFEIFCMKNIKAIAAALGIGDVFKRFGSYWQKETKRREGVQIDIVIERTDRVTHLVECKWSAGKVGKSIVEEMERKKRLYPNPENHTLRMTLITTLGATDQVKEASAIDDIITLEDILG